GYSVYVPRYPGHGTTIEDMTSTYADDWFHAAREAYLELCGQCKTVYVAGLSMGSLFTVLLSREFNIPKIALMSMPAAIPDKTIYAAPIVKHFAPIMYNTEEQIRVMTKGINNPSDRAVHVSYYQGTPVAQAWELHKTIKKAKSALPAVKAKTLLVQSHGDETIPAWSLDYIDAHIGTKDKEKLWLEKSNHVVCFDYDKDTVAAKVISFFNK
ncbi:MAG: alpha/beta hydrolase, partial [Spirochaetota bacterium]